MPKPRLYSDEQRLIRSRAAVARYHFKSKYGITEAQRDEMAVNQDNKCAICYTTFTSAFNTHVDHCHTTNKVRGVLCNQCNHGLGKFKDNKTLLTNAIAYLDHHND